MKNLRYKNKVFFVSLVIIMSLVAAPLAQASILGDFFRSLKASLSVGGGINTITSLPIKTFLGLTDTPNSYSGQGTKIVSVKADESGLEFTTGSGGSGITSINSDTTAAQTLATSTTATDFTITHDLSGTHTFNLPVASATATGKLSSTDWTTFNNKGSGTVTSVSVATANGLAGSSSGGATPALTLSTTVTGVLKGNGTAISAATAGTDYVTDSSTNTFTNKTYDTAGSGNVLRINGTGISAVTGVGAVVLASSPTISTPTLGVAAATSINKVAITAPATSATLTIADGKTLTASNSITLAGTDGKGINVGAATTGKILIGDGSNMVLSTPTFPNTATANKIMKADGTNWVASTETYAAPGTNKNVMKSDGTNWTSAAPTFEGMVEAISFQDAGTSISNTTYVLELYAEYAYTINEMRIVSGAGTVTANLKIGSTSVTSCSAVSVSTSITSCTASGANTVAVGDKITLVTTSASSLDNLQATIKTTRN